MQLITVARVSQVGSWHVNCRHSSCLNVTNPDCNKLLPVYRWSFGARWLKQRQRQVTEDAIKGMLYWARQHSIRGTPLERKKKKKKEKKKKVLSVDIKNAIRLEFTCRRTGARRGLESFRRLTESFLVASVTTRHQNTRHYLTDICRCSQPLKQPRRVFAVSALWRFSR